MGNSGSSRSNQDRYIPHSEELKKLYHKVCDYGLLNQDLFSQYFKGPCENVAKNLFGTYFVDLLNSSDVTANLFVQRANSILESCSQITINLICILIYLMITHKNLWIRQL